MSQTFFRFFVVGLLLIIAVSVYRYTNGSVMTGQGSVSKEDMAKIVEETLLKKPELVIQAAEQYQKTLQQKQETDRQDLLTTIKPELAKATGFPIVGNPDAPITIYEFLDYNCGYCKIMTPVVNAVADATKDVRFVILDFPILAPSSEDAARAALAANKQGKFRPLHDAMMAHKGALSKEAIVDMAKTAGLDVEKLKADMAGPEVSKELAASQDFAKRLQLNGTPSFLIGDAFIPGALSKEALMEKIDALRTAAPKKP
ncbi:MAG: DsbA family protein [Alphaproteobacteria bacterium]